jgi:predicted DNA-binding transcriptional regulator AlpA
MVIASPHSILQRHPAEDCPESSRESHSGNAADRSPIPALLTQQLVRRFYLPLSERAFWRWVSAGKFPKPDISMGGKARFWKRETVERWIANQAVCGDVG